MLPCAVKAFVSLGCINAACEDDPADDAVAAAVWRACTNPPCTAACHVCTTGDSNCRTCAAGQTLVRGVATCVAGMGSSGEIATQSTMSGVEDDDGLDDDSSSV